MSEFIVLMPKMGESVQEATITKWFVKEGDKIDEDDLLFEIATENVDSEIPSPVDGVLKKIVFVIDAVVPVGEIVALIETGDEVEDKGSHPGNLENETEKEEVSIKKTGVNKTDFSKSSRFYSPLVKSIASKENISVKELETITGSGLNGRVQKKDILAYIEEKSGNTALSVESKWQNIQTLQEFYSSVILFNTSVKFWSA